MGQGERITKLSNWLAEPRGLGKADAMRRLEVSASTFKRDLDVLRDRLNVPVCYDARNARYCAAIRGLFAKMLVVKPNEVDMRSAGRGC